jgi:hydroxymethylpyrimidine/phosphomethylpyrimidine kinase
MANSPKPVVSMEDVYKSISNQSRVEVVTPNISEYNSIPNSGHPQDIVPREEISAESLDNISVSKNTSGILNSNDDENAALEKSTSASTPNLDDAKAIAQKQEISSNMSMSQLPSNDDIQYALTPHEKYILDKQLSLEEIKIGFFGLFRYATTLDKIILGISVLAAIAGGAVIPLMTVSKSFCYFLVC